MEYLSSETKGIALDILEDILSAIERLEERTKNIHDVGDFLGSSSGMVLLDATCMLLIAIGESLKSLDKTTNGNLLSSYPSIPWKNIAGFRDIAAHKYQTLRMEDVYETVSSDFPVLKEQIEREKYPENYIPYNKIMDENMKKYYNTKQFTCSELETNDMNRLFNRYDSTNTGIFRKDDIQMIFFEIKDLLQQKGIEINENKLINFMLDFYSQADDFVTKNDIKNCYNKILHQYKANMLNDKILVTDLDYIKGIAMGNQENEKIGESEIIKKDEKAPRNDIFYIKTTSEKKGRTLILNENKLAKLYQ